MSWCAGNREQLCKAAEWQFSGAGEVLSSIHAHFQSKCAEVVQIDVDLVRGVISGCHHKYVAERRRRIRQFPAPALIAAAIESERSLERRGYLLGRDVEALVIEWTA